MFIFVAAKILNKNTGAPLQTFEELKTLLLNLSQDEAINRITQVKREAFTLRKEIVDRLMNLYAFQKKDSNDVFYFIVTEEFGKMSHFGA